MLTAKDHLIIVRRLIEVYRRSMVGPPWHTPTDLLDLEDKLEFDASLEAVKAPSLEAEHDAL